MQEMDSAPTKSDIMGGKRNQVKKKSSAVKEGSHMIDEDTPRKQLNFDTPKVKQRVHRGNKAALVTLSTNKRAKGNITFKVR